MPVAAAIIPAAISAVGGIIASRSKAGQTAERDYGAAEQQANKLNSSAEQFMTMMQDRWNFYKDHGEGIDIAFIDQAMKDYNAGTGAAESRGVADVNTAYDRSGAIQQRNLARYGVNLGSPAAAALSNQTAISRAGDEAFQRDRARREQEQVNLQKLGMASDIGHRAIGDAADFGRIGADQNEAAARLFSDLGSQATKSAAGISRMVGDVAGRVPWDKVFGGGSGGEQGVVDTSSPGPWSGGYNFPDNSGGGGGTDYTQYTPEPSNYVQPQQGGYAEGGVIHGPGSSTSDSVPIRASNGEYVIPADVVAQKGREFFDNVISKTRTRPGGGKMSTEISHPSPGQRARDFMRNEHVMSHFVPGRSPTSRVGEVAPGFSGRGQVERPRLRMSTAIDTRMGGQYLPLRAATR